MGAALTARVLGILMDFGLIFPSDLSCVMGMRMYSRR
jgi:hypothetical protein